MLLDGTHQRVSRISQLICPYNKAREQQMFAEPLFVQLGTSITVRARLNQVSVSHPSLEQAHLELVGEYGG